MKALDDSSPYYAELLAETCDFVERQARKQAVTVAKIGDCFVEGSDFGQVNRLAARRQNWAIGC